LEAGTQPFRKHGVIFTIDCGDCPFKGTEFPLSKATDFPRVTLTMSALSKLAECESGLLSDLSKKILAGQKQS
jgi:hypothetical protein